MVAYTYSKLPTANFNTTPPSIARSATGSVYDVGDTGFTTPLNMTMVVGGAVVTTISSNALGFLPDFTLDGRVSCVWKQTGATFATVLTTSDPIPGPPGPNTIPTDTAIASNITTPGTATAGALNATYLDKVSAAATYTPAPIPALESVQFTNYGDSYGDGAQGADQASRPFDRIAVRSRTQPLVHNAQAGKRMDEILARIVATWTTNGRGLIGFSDGVINDEKQYADNAGATTTREAFRSCLAYLTAQSVSPYSGSAFIFGPNWTAGTSSTVGSYVDFAYTGNTAHLLVNFVTGAGGTLEVRNSSDVAIATVATGGFKNNFTGSVKISGLGAGPNSVRIVLTSGTATIIGAAVMSPTPPVIAWDKPGRINSSDTEATRIALYLSTSAAILGDFPTVIPVDMTGWDYTTMISGDATHRNDQGNLFAANLIEKALRTYLGTNFQQGLNALTAVTGTATYTTPTPAYAKTGATVPAQVTGFIATTASQISFVWAKPSDGGATLASYVIQASPAGTNTWSTVATPTGAATSAVVASGLNTNTSYDFRIAAVNAIGTGAYSATSTATTPAPIVTYAADTFTRADGAVGSTETGAYAWASIGSTNSIKSNAMSFDSVAVAGNGSTVLINDGQSNGTFQLTRKNNGSGSPGLFFRGDATSFTGYVFWQSGTTYTLSKRTAQAAYTQLATAAGVSPVVGDVITVIANGSSIIVKINGTQVISVTDATYAGTYHGAWSQAVGSVDDFSHTSALA